MISVNVIGAGLAGCEAAFQLAKRNIHVDLWEMKPHKKSPAHSSDDFCELVCSNSLRSDALSNAVGLLKHELRELDSLIMQAADYAKVPAGGALAVNRNEFSGFVTHKIRNNPFITVHEREITGFDCFNGQTVIIAAGPLASDALTDSIITLTGNNNLHFFDAAAPIVSSESIDMNRAFFASRYGKGDGDDYLNCPMNQKQYMDFYHALITAECALVKDFEHNVFEGCMPIEEIALRGPLTMAYGPLKPKGIYYPGTHDEPFANVQLRKEDKKGSMYNIVGFQTHLRFPEQKRVFSMIPALENAEFLRYGVMHKNTFICAPKLLDRYYRLKSDNSIFFAGQITGVEGYIESTASGFLAGLFCACDMKGLSKPVLSDTTAIGALAEYVSSANAQNYQPMNINYGIMKPLEKRIRNKEERCLGISGRSLEEIKCLKAQLSAL